MEDALERLETVAVDEARMAAAEALKAIHGVGTNVQNSLKAVEDRMRGMEGTYKSQGVDDRVKDIGDKTISGAQTVSSVITTLIVYTIRCREYRTTNAKRF